MFCTKCGAQMSNEETFCSACGEYNGQVPLDMPKGKEWRIAAIIACAVLIVGAGVFAACEFLFKPSDNCLQVTYQAMKNISELSEFDFNTTIAGEETIEGSVRLGKDVRSSVINVEAGEHRMVLVNGDFAMKSTNFLYPSYTYQEDVCGFLADKLEDGLGVRVDFNGTVKDGRIVLDPIDKAIKEITDTMDDMNPPALNLGVSRPDDSTYMVRSVVRYLENWKEYLSMASGPVVENFFMNKCKDEKLLEKIVSDLKVSTKDGLTTYRFTVEAKELAYAFKDYVDEGVRKNKEEFDSDLWRQISEFDKDDIDEIDDVELDFVVTVDKKNMMHSLKVEGDDILIISYKLTNHNKSKVDVADAEDFIEEARKNY